MIDAHTVDQLKQLGIVVQDGNYTYIAMPFVIREHIAGEFRRFEILPLGGIPVHVKEKFKKTKK
jgi:hypothetical protein